ncbi:hypothetical protein BOX30_05350 [Leptospirillum ferriphilum]|nr:hypothetical protein BOX30_05350 [Leptospirillum ferriphilum]
MLTEESHRSYNYSIGIGQPVLYSNELTVAKSSYQRILSASEQIKEILVAMSEISESIDNLRLEVKADLKDLRLEVKGEIKEVRDSVDKMRAEAKTDFRWIVGIVLTAGLAIISTFIVTYIKTSSHISSLISLIPPHK